MPFFSVSSTYFRALLISLNYFLLNTSNKKSLAEKKVPTQNQIYNRLQLKITFRNGMWVILVSII